MDKKDPAVTEDWQSVVRKWLQDSERSQAFLARKIGYTSEYLAE